MMQWLGNEELMHLSTKADLHLHTTFSDGTASVPELLAHAAASDLQIIAITDHDTVAGAIEARRLADHFGVEVIVGEEVSTADGHLLALWIDEWLPPGRPAAATIAAVHAQGGLCIAAHPYDWAVMSLGQAGLRERCLGRHAEPWQLDAIEVFNASLCWPRGACNRVALEVAGAIGLPAIGGSDAHSLATVGRGYTLFNGTTAADLRQAIVSGVVGWGGQPWSAAQYIDVSWRTVRQRSIWWTLRWACTDLPFLVHRDKQHVVQSAHETVAL